MNTQNTTTHRLNSINQQARYLMRDNRQTQQNRRLSLLQRAIEQIEQ